MCTLDPEKVTGRPRAKMLRVWNVLLAWCGADRNAPGSFLAPAGPVYEENEGGQIPPYMDR